MKRYKIGDIAKLLGLTTQALRFYEQEGVIVPQKSENGTRYFTTADIIRLLGFKKYRLSEFSIQDVALHFKQGSLESLVEQLDVQSDALIEQSEMLLRRARAIRSFERTLREAKRLEGQLTCMMSNETYLHNLTFDQLNALDDRQRASFIAFADAMPESGTYFICPADGSTGPEFRFGIGRREAEAWLIPLEDTISLPSVRCVRVYMRVAGHPWERQYLQPLLEQVRAAGYTLDSAHPILGQHLASETLARVIYLYAVVWIPIL